MARTFLMLAVVFGFLGVAIGAFGAHGLTATFEANPGNEDTYHTATQYQMYHALALLAVGILELLRTRQGTSIQQRYLKFAGWLFVTGIIFFSGSLYLLSVFNLRFMGAIAPLGGLAMLGGWLCLGFSLRSVSE